MHPNISILKLVLGKPAVHVPWFEVLWTIPCRRKFSTQWRKRPRRKKNSDGLKTLSPQNSCMTEWWCHCQHYFFGYYLSC